MSCHGVSSARASAAAACIQPAPTKLDEITDLDVELLIEAGRPVTARAGRMLPGLAHLNG